MDDREKEMRRKEAIKACNEALDLLDKITDRYEKNNDYFLNLMKGEESED
jgi:hypothetical protein